MPGSIFGKPQCVADCCVVLLLDPVLSPDAVLKPYEPYAINVLHSVLDPQLSLSDITQLVESVNATCML